jgi:glycosyltransferase involved in cell wall biosynthesis
MKFSVLLPTRNRLEYLRYAVETVRRQDYSNWEVIVSDNCSEEDVAGYVHSLNESRIKYFRTRELVPVTQNWNNALQRCDGDYVVMLGDDDGLLPGYFSTLLRTFQTHPAADYVYVSGYFFAYRGALPNEPDGFLRRDRNSVFHNEEASWLDAKVARSIALDYLDFRMPVASNMQFSLISRRLIEELTRSGPFFRSPFPDFYATPLLFLRSERILICPNPMVVVGITPKSYGTFHFSDRASQGATMLHNDRSLKNASSISSMLLPGTSYYDSWLLAMEELRATDDNGASVWPNYRRYRFLQIVHGYKRRYFDRKLSVADLRTLRLKMTASEVALYALSLPVFFTLLRLVSDRPRARIVAALRRLLGQHAIRSESTVRAQHQNLLEVYESMDVDRVAR